MSSAVGPPRTIHAVLARHARRQPDARAIVCQDRVLSYGELHRESSRTAAAIRAAGLLPGARVAFLGKESEHYYDVVFGCAKSATVVVPINWRLAADEVDHILRDSTAGLVFVEQAFRPAADLVADRLPWPVAVVTIDHNGQIGAGLRAWKADRSDAGSDRPDASTGPDDPVAQIYTSGTTGLPKGVVLAHRSFFAVHDALEAAALDWIDWRADDVSLIAVPGFHIGGLWWAVQGFNAGVTNVAMRMFVSADAIEAIRKHQVSTTCLVPSMLQMMLAEPGRAAGDFVSLRKVAYGGSPISEDLLERCLDQIGCAFVQLYGMTETGNTAVCLPPAEHVVGNPRIRSAGRPYPGFGLRIVDPDGQDVAPGLAGEIWIRTPGRMIEYFGRAEATSSTLVDGWVRTGDAGYVDPDGFVYICDRIKDAVIVAGENLYPAEIERVLAEHPAVLETAIVGRPDDRWGEALHAFVVKRPAHAVTPRELMVFLRGKMADHKIPASYEFLDALPRNPSGKVLKRKLRDGFWRDRDRQVN